MRFSPAQLIPPVLGLLLLLLVLNLTMFAVRTSGAWQRATQRSVVKESPYAALEFMLARPDSTGAPARDPFTSAAVAVATPVRTGPVRVVPPPPPPRPVLTSIIWDNDPRATVRWNNRDYSVRENTLFAEFRVVTITRDQVVLDRGGESVVLRLPVKGE